MPTPERSRYESVERGVTRQHQTKCRFMAGSRCNCAPSYRADLSDPVTKRRRTKNFDSLQAARRWRADMHNRMASGSARLYGRATVSEVWADWWEAIHRGEVRADHGGNYKPSVLRAYESKMRNYVLPRFGQVALAELRASQVQTRLVDDLAGKGASASSIANCVMPLRVLYRWAILRELATVNPCQGLMLPSGGKERDRIASPGEALALIQSAPESDRLIWATAFFAGLRRGELMALDWTKVHLDAEHPYLEVVRAFDPTIPPQQPGVPDKPPILGRALGRKGGAFITPKSKKAVRQVGLPAVLVTMLATSNRTAGLVFGPDGHRPFDGAKVAERGRTTWAAAGMEPIGLHEARHTYASIMIAAGANIKLISEWMGHASVQITLDRYGHLLPGHRAEALGIVNDYLAREGVVL